MILINNNLVSEENFSEELFDSGLNIYEVFRVFAGRVMFLNDNILRLSNSLKRLNINIDIKSLNLDLKLQKIIDALGIKEGNLKYVMSFRENYEFDEYLYKIPHSYPSAQDYIDGVSTITYKTMRKNPEVKYINTNLRNLTNALIKVNNVFEVLLVDDEGYLTEGSRSNLFFSKDNVIYTASTEYVLPGTSRKRVFELCKREHIKIVEERVKYSDLSSYDFVFLTGTSPLLLPINKINNIEYSTAQPLLRKLVRMYQEMNERPVLNKSLDADVFYNFYWLKKELIEFCSAHGLPTSGGKIEITERIFAYLKSGEIVKSKTTSVKKPIIETITEETEIELNFICSEKHRAFFIKHIGKTFSFNVVFQKWLKANTGKTYAQAIIAYYEILEEKKKGKTVITKQFEYNTYIRDFFADNEGKSLQQAIKCWKYKKSLNGHNSYEKSDLVALSD